MVIEIKEGISCCSWIKSRDMPAAQNAEFITQTLRILYLFFILVRPHLS
jgi:hypothetical protein